MIKDYYNILGVTKDASPEEIKRAYRKLAAKHHPDREGGSTEEFQRIEESYRILSDPRQREQYDNATNPFKGFGEFNNSSPNFGMPPNDLRDLFEQLFKQSQQHSNSRHNPTYRTVVFLTLEDVYKGQQQSIRIQTNTGSHHIKLDVPRGVADGSQLRYENLIPDGPLIVEFRNHPHMKFQRVGNDIHVNQRISVLDLIVGSTIEWVGLDDKTLLVTVPPKTQPNMTLKIGGAGMPIMNTNFYGDAYINLKPYVPEYIHDDIITSIKTNNI